MFERNDKALRIAHTLFKICLWIFLIMCLIVGIVGSIVFENGWYVLISLCGLLVCFIGWIVHMLVYSFLCDVKLIRNKLYGESNEGLDDFLKTYKERVVELEEREKKEEEKEAELAHLYQLMEQGIITEDEYKKRENDITERE